MVPTVMEKTSNEQMVQSIVRAHSWIRMLRNGTHTSIEHLASSVGLHPKVIRNNIRLAFLDKRLVAAILKAERLPPLSLGNFTGRIPLSWNKQCQLLNVC